MDECERYWTEPTPVLSRGDFIRDRLHDAILLLEEAEELLRDPRHGSVYKDYWDKVHAWFAKVRAK